MKTLYAAPAFALLVLGSAQAASVNKGVAGFLDPRTGTFTAKVTSDTPDSTTISRATGTIAVTVTIAVEAAIAANTPIYCSLDFAYTGYPLLEDVGVLQVTAKRSGATATCTANLPYNWNVTSQEKNGSLSVTVSTGSLTSQSGSELTSVQHSFANNYAIALPAAAGTVTKFAVSPPL